MPALHLVYCVTDDYSGLEFPVITSVFFIIFTSATIAYYRKKENILTKLFELAFEENAWNSALMGAVFSGVFLCFVTFLSVPPLIRVRNIYNENQLQYIEGRVTEYSPMPYAGHENEYFEVKGVKFWFSNYDEGGHYNNAASHGGVIKPGLYVRIGYYYTGFQNDILKLETE